jgi:hypothetical protein
MGSAVLVFDFIHTDLFLLVPSSEWAGTGYEWTVESS